MMTLQAVGIATIIGCCFIAFHTELAGAALTLRVRLHSYRNRLSQDALGFRCDSTGTSVCENEFEFCLTRRSSITCLYRITSSGHYEDDDFIFTPLIVSQLGISNPLEFVDVPDEPLCLKITIEDYDPFTSDDLVDIINVNLNAPSTIHEEVPQFYNGTFGMSRMELSFQVSNSTVTDTPETATPTTAATPHTTDLPGVALTLRVRLHSYRNPLSQDALGLRCDSIGTSECENEFQFCLTRRSSTICLYEISSSGHYEDDDFTFTPSIVSRLGISNPLEFADVPDEPLHLKITIEDYDPVSPDDLVDIIDVNINAPSTIHEEEFPQFYTGTFGASRMELSFQVTTNTATETPETTAPTTTAPTTEVTPHTTELAGAALTLRVRLHSYRNPLSQDALGLRCDSIGTSECENEFQFCLTRRSSTTCLYEISSSGHYEDDHFTFTPSIVSRLGISNPLDFADVPDEPLDLKITIEDYDPFTRDDLVDIISVNLNAPSTLYEAFTFPQFYTGIYGVSTMELSFQVTESTITVTPESKSVPIIIGSVIGTVILLLVVGIAVCVCCCCIYADLLH